MIRIPPAPAKSRPRAGVAAACCLLLLLLSSLAPACRLYRLERRLNPQYADFYSKVQYIMTREERKIFLELPDSDRDEFIGEFWQRRNPNPEAEENVFKIEYESRVKRAGDLFRSEGKPGHLTDRGRIYILFGPPMERLTYPMDAAGFCREVWYYGAFPVIFVDEHCEGQFLITAINLEHLQALNIAQGNFAKTFDQEKRFFDYDVKLVKIRADPSVFEGRVVIEVPYAGIWFNSRDGRLTTTLDVRLEARNAAGARLWEASRAYPLDLGGEELKAKKDESFLIEVPLVLDRDVGKLKGQRLTLHASIENSAEGGRLKKVLEFRLEP
jgi:GWxTD domain-containing protein